MRWKNALKRTYKSKVKNIICHGSIESRNNILSGMLKKIVAGMIYCRMYSKKSYYRNDILADILQKAIMIKHSIWMIKHSMK